MADDALRHEYIYARGTGMVSLWYLVASALGVLMLDRAGQGKSCFCSFRRHFALVGSWW